MPRANADVCLALASLWRVVRPARIETRKTLEPPSKARGWVQGPERELQFVVNGEQFLVHWDPRCVAQMGVTAYEVSEAFVSVLPR